MYLLAYGLAPCFMNEIVLHITREPCGYSLALDESNIVCGSRRFISLMVSCVEPSFEIHMIIPLKTMELPDLKAEILEKNVVTTPSDCGLPTTKCVAIMSDGRSIMTGCHSGFHVRMKQRRPQFLPLPTRTLIHVLNVACISCELLGHKIENLADNIFCCFRYTSRCR